jgi:hypothetical protein
LKVDWDAVELQIAQQIFIKRAAQRIKAGTYDRNNNGASTAIYFEAAKDFVTEAKKRYPDPAAPTPLDIGDRKILRPLSDDEAAELALFRAQVLKPPDPFAYKDPDDFNETHR